MPAKTKSKRAAPSRKTAKKTKAKARKSAAPAARTGGITPYLAVGNAEKAIAWYKDVFGAKVVELQHTPQGQVMHATLTFAGSQLFLSDILPMSDLKDPAKVGATVNVNVHSPKIENFWQNATSNGATVTMPIDDMFWGDRYGRFIDPFGHSWALSWKSKLSKAALAKKAEEAMKSFGQ